MWLRARMPARLRGLVPASRYVPGLRPPELARQVATVRTARPWRLRTSGRTRGDPVWREPPGAIRASDCAPPAGRSARRRAVPVRFESRAGCRERHATPADSRVRTEPTAVGSDRFVLRPAAGRR